MELLQLGMETLMQSFIYLTIIVVIAACGTLALLGIAIYQLDKIKRKLKA